MRYPLSSRANELLAMSILRFRAVNRSHNPESSLAQTWTHTERQKCRLCGYNKEDTVHTVCQCPGLACKRYRFWGSRFLKPEDVEKMRVGSLLSLVDNAGLGLVS
jgi:hypothetical protein